MVYALSDKNTIELTTINTCIGKLYIKKIIRMRCSVAAWKNYKPIYFQISNISSIRKFYIFDEKTYEACWWNNITPLFKKNIDDTINKM